MNKEQARNLVRQTLTQSFDKARFQKFVLELLNDFDESKAFVSNKTYIKDAFKPHVERFERLGTYTSADREKLDVLIVHLTKGSKLERARTAIRNFVADHLKQRDGKDGALVAFVSPSERQWRFSYVKMEYATVEKDSGKVGVETKLTPARRFSYIVGEGESCHTAQTRFLDLLQDTEEGPVLAQIEDAFSVEAVTREFFQKYAGLFDEIQKAIGKLAAKDSAIRSEFIKKHIRTADFAKKLMGQIVFLYFIQKKGWLGVTEGQDWGTGPRDFLRHLARGDYGQYKNFFNDVLEPLFYDTLATDRGHLAWCKRFNCRIPFLNGGLFEPLADYNWRKTDITLPNRLFTNNERFDDFSIGTGLLDMFDRYNFTVNEAEPLEKEVAIDPEMLGKVFENLIEDNLRKGLGSYYTPREIVHYMCQESLINYLDTALNSATETIGREKRKQAEFGDEKFEQTLLAASARNEIVPRADIQTFLHLGDQISHYEAVDTRYAIKMPKSIEKHARIIDAKLANITVCDPAVGSGAFPVGMMSEIVRARSALTPYFNDVHERTPYQFKRHAIQDCLYGVDIDPGAVEIAKLRLWLSLVVDEEDVRQIKPLPNLDYKIVLGDSLLSVEKDLFNNELFKRLEDLKPKFFSESDRKNKSLFKISIDDLIHQLTNRKEVFDFEIHFSEVFHEKRGFDVIIANPPYNELRDLSRSQQDAYNQSPYYDDARGGRVNLFQFFYPLALTIARKPAIVCLITQNSLLAEDSAVRNRRLIVDKSRIIRFVSFPERDDLKKRVFESAKMSVCIGILETWIAPLADYKFHISVWYDRDFSNGHALDLRLSDIKKLFPTTLVFPMSSQSSFNLLRRTKTKKDVFFVNAKSGEIDMTRYKRRFNTSGKGNRVLTGAQVLRFRTTNKPSQGAVVFLDDALADISPEKTEDALAERVVMQRITGVDSNRRLIMTLAPQGVLCANSTNYVSANTHPNLKYLLGVLNSKFINYYFKQTSTNTNITTSEINQVPIAKASTKTLQRITNLVTRIIGKKERDGEADTSALEREIDELVFSLYDLTPEEIQIVERASAATHRVSPDLLGRPPGPGANPRDS